MKTKIFITVLVLVFISFLVPELPEGTAYSQENLVMVRINPTGNRLLVRTAEHDYEFVLPPNHIVQAVAFSPLASRLGYWYLEDLNVSPTGQSRTILRSRQGPDVHGVPFPSGALAKLKEFGFVREGNMEETDPYFDLAIDIDLLEGQQFPAKAKGEFPGTDIWDDRYDSIGVHTLDEATEKNRNTNQYLQPLIAVKHAAMYCLLVPFLLFTGFRPGA